MSAEEQKQMQIQQKFQQQQEEFFITDEEHEQLLDVLENEGAITPEDRVRLTLSHAVNPITVEEFNEIIDEPIELLPIPQFNNNMTRSDLYKILKHYTNEETMKELGIWGTKGNKTKILIELSKLKSDIEEANKEITKFNEDEDSQEFNIPPIEIIPTIEKMEVDLEAIPTDEDTIEINQNIANQADDLQDIIDRKDYEEYIMFMSNLREDTPRTHNIIQVNYILDDDGNYVENKIFTLSDDFIDRLKDIWNDTNGTMISFEIHGSDEDYVLGMLNPLSTRTEIRAIKKPTISQEGNFFNYVNTSGFDLSKLQIYSEEQLRKLKNIDNCLINCLVMLDIEDSKIEEIKMGLKSDYVPKKGLKEVAKIIGKNIMVKYLETGKFRVYRADKVYKHDTITICLFKDHYFPKIKLPITSFAIKNWMTNERVRTNPIIRAITKDREYLTCSRFTTSDKIVKAFWQYKLFQRSEELKRFEQSRYCNPQTKDILTNINNEQEEMETKDKEDIKHSVFFADFETFQNEGVNKIQKPFMLGVVDEKSDNVKIFTNTNKYSVDNNKAFWKMCDYLISNSEEDSQIVVYYHNLKFDFNFIEKHGYMKNIIKKAGNLFGATMYYKKRTIEFRDSYKMISNRLSSFKKAFSLSVGKKEYIPYNFYNSSNIKKMTVPLEEFKASLNEEYDEEDYRSLIEPYIAEGKMKHMKYMRDYLVMDCLTLQQGFNKFRETMKELTDIDSFDKLTLASLADDYMINEGCYDGVYRLKGNILNFVMGSVMGGRCCTKDNEKHMIFDPLLDLDCNSLYPSAMKRLKDDGYGFPSGKAVILDTTDYNVIKDLPYYIVSIRITAINKYQQIPFVTYKNADGGRDYTNEPRPDIIKVDKITLEDWIEFQEIEFEIINGIYWSSFNDKIGETIDYLYNARKEAKANGEELKQSNLKLLMNSSYGKTLLKPEKHKYKYISKDKNIQYLSKNFNQVVNMINVGNQYRIKEYNNRFNHYNRAHCGGIILSMSKRIMNELMNLAQDLGIIIYYQDTDSMHIEKERIEELEIEYLRKYGKVLCGDNLCQFNSDLEIKGFDAWTTCSIILGKKCYYDAIENKHGTGEHIRMKSVGSQVVKAQAIHNNTTPRQLYIDLYNGEQKKFDLVLGSVKFKQMDNGIKRLNEFVRMIKF